VIPEIREVRITPADFTLQVGDTAPIRATVIGTGGDTLRDVPLLWQESDASVAALVSVAGAPPPGTAVEARRGGDAVIAVEVATSRQDSASRVQGRARVTVLP
jgi:hypothetical protein